MSPIELGLRPDDLDLTLDLTESPDEERLGELVVQAGYSFVLEDGECGSIEGIYDDGELVKFGHTKYGAWIGTDKHRYVVNDWSSISAKGYRQGVWMGATRVRIYPSKENQPDFSFTFEPWLQQKALDAKEALRFDPESVEGVIKSEPDLVDSDEWWVLESYLREKVRFNTDDIDVLLARIYQQATIHLVKVDPSLIVPTAKYVLKENLTRVEALDKELKEKGIDMFNLTSIAKATDNYDICPPILEVWDEEPYNGRAVIVDGAHRLYYAMSRGININCVLISGNIFWDLPILPLGGWDEVEVRDTVPKDKRNYNLGMRRMAKTHGFMEFHEFYRQPLPGSGGPRTAGES